MCEGKPGYGHDASCHTSVEDLAPGVVQQINPAVGESRQQRGFSRHHAGADAAADPSCPEELLNGGSCLLVSAKLLKMVGRGKWGGSNYHCYSSSSSESF